MAARRDRRIEAEGRGLRGGVDRDSGAFRSPSSVDRGEGEIGGVERDRVGRLQHLDVDRDAARRSADWRRRARPRSNNAAAGHCAAAGSAPAPPRAGGGRGRGAALGRVAGAERKRESGGGEQQSRAHEIYPLSRARSRDASGRGVCQTKFDASISKARGAAMALEDMRAQILGAPAPVAPQPRPAGPDRRSPR